MIDMSSSFERADAVAIVFIVVPWMVCFISGLLQIEMDGLIQGHRGFETLVSPCRRCAVGFC